MRSKVLERSYDEILELLRREGFDVREVSQVAAGGAGTELLVSKYGAGAVLTRNPSPGPKMPPGDKVPRDRYAVMWVTHPGLLLGGQVSTLLDRGFQKFFTTPKLTVAATADGLKAVHRFAEELREIIGEPSLYNESLGSVSDSYLYDRVKGRDLPEAERPVPAWDRPGRS